MKNIQVVDGALNCTFPIFAATDEEFKSIFSSGTDIEFAGDFVERVGEDMARRVLDAIWDRPVEKKVVYGIHGTIFYNLDERKKYFPDKTEAGMNPLPDD